MELKEKLAARRRELEAEAELVRRATAETAAAARSTTLQEKQTTHTDEETPGEAVNKRVANENTPTENWGVIFFFGGLISFFVLPWWVGICLIVLGLYMAGKKA